MVVDDFKAYLTMLLADAAPIVSIETYRTNEQPPIYNPKVTDTDGRTWHLEIVTTAPRGGDGNRHSNPKPGPGIEVVQRGA